MRIVLADEISPDSCRLWDIKSNDKLDKDRFRSDLGGMIEAYTEVARRLGIVQENGRLGRASPSWCSKKTASIERASFSHSWEKVAPRSGVG